jgi:hypothetical protein
MSATYRVGDHEFGLAGNKMVVRATDEGMEISFDDKGTGRVCGSCQLCCKLLPVPDVELRKPAGVRCQYSKVGKGCTIYARRPFACKVWSCRWLAAPETAGLPRPDKAHYVIDLEEDTVDQVDNETGARTKYPVLQVWVDPAFPNAHEDPQLRRYLHRMAEQYKVGAIIRYDSRRAFTLWAPPFCADGEWHTVEGVVVARDETDRVVLELADRLAEHQPPQQQP